MFFNSISVYRCIRNKKKTDLSRVLVAPIQLNTFRVCVNNAENRKRGKGNIKPPMTLVVNTEGIDEMIDGEDPWR